MAGKLAQCGRGAMHLECRLDCLVGGDCPDFRVSENGTVPLGPPVRVSVGLFQPTASVKHLFQLVEMQFERLRLPAPVAAMRLAATATAPLEYRQQELFLVDGRSAERDARYVAALIDRLSTRLGRCAVVRVRLRPEAQPELAWQEEPLIAGLMGRRGSRRVAQKLDPSELPPRPLRLLPRPIRLGVLKEAVASAVKQRGSGFRVQGSAHEPLDQSPVSHPQSPIQSLGFRLHGCEHRIVRAWGPERIETGWWRGRPIGRDYYQVETASGQRYWIFRRLRDGKWFLHGMFE